MQIANKGEITYGYFAADGIVYKMNQ